MPLQRAGHHVSAWSRGRATEQAVVWVMANMIIKLSSAIAQGTR